MNLKLFLLVHWTLPQRNLHSYINMTVTQPKGSFKKNVKCRFGLGPNLALTPSSSHIWTWTNVFFINICPSLCPKKTRKTLQFGPYWGYKCIKAVMTLYSDPPFQLGICQSNFVIFNTSLGLFIFGGTILSILPEKF